MADAWHALYGLLDGALAINPRSMVEELNFDDIDTLPNVNIRGTVLTTHTAIPNLKDGRRTITIGSNLAELVPFPGSPSMPSPSPHIMPLRVASRANWSPTTSRRI